MDRTAQRPTRSLLVISAFMLLLSIGRLSIDQPLAEMETTNTWWPIVNNVLDGEGFASCFEKYFPFCGPENNTTAARGPVPVYMHAALAAVSGRSLWAAVGLHLVLGIVCAWLLFFVGERWGNKRIGLMAAAFWALYLSAYQMLPKIGGEQTAMFFSLLAILVLQRAFQNGKALNWFLCGALVGLAMLCRSSLMAFIPAIGAAVLFSKTPFTQRAKRILFVGLGLLLVLGPWSYRNHQELGTWSFGSTLSGYNVFRHNSVLDQDDFLQYVGPNEAYEKVKVLIAEHPELKGDENEVVMNKLYMAEGTGYMKAQPWRYVKLSFYRLFVMWTNWKVSEASNDVSGIEDYLVSIQQLLLLILGLIGLRLRSGFEQAIFLTLVIYCAMHMGVVGRIRYLLPLMPILLLFAARGLEKLVAPRTST